jgi:ParB family transcriptional regulator, chromosome partitioning protein
VSNAKHYRTFSDIIPEDSNASKEKADSVGLLEQGQVRVEDVIVLPSHEDLDDEVVSFIAESFPVSGGGPFNPIVVRRVRQEEDGKDVTKTVLVAGAHRLQAALYTAMEYINCIYIEGDETAARIVQIAEDLFRKNLTVLKRAEMLAEWLSLALVNFSGQLVQKGQGGRPLHGIVRAARALPVVARSVDARRKILDRAVRIARLAPEVKKAAKKTGLDDNQRALLKIAKAKGRKAQQKRLQELAASNSHELPKQKHMAATDSGDGAAKKSPPKSDADGTTDNAEDNAEDNSDESADESGAETAKAPVKRETTFDQLEAFWNREGRKLWRYTPFSERERFIEMLRRAKCEATIDVVSFVQDVFRGRDKVRKHDLFGLAKTRGLSKKAVREAVKLLGYRQKREGHGLGAVWYLWRKALDWKDELKVIKDTELRNAGMAHSTSSRPRLPKGMDLMDPATYAKKRRERVYGKRRDRISMR